MTLVEALRALRGPEAHLESPARRVLASDRIDEELKRIAVRVIHEEGERLAAVQLALLRLLDIPVNPQRRENDFVDAPDPDDVPDDAAEVDAVEGVPVPFGGASDAQAYSYLRTALIRGRIDLLRAQHRWDERYPVKPLEIFSGDATPEDEIASRKRDQRLREILAEMDLCRLLLESDVAPAAIARMRQGAAITFQSTFQQLLELRDSELSMNAAVDAELGSPGVAHEAPAWLKARDKLYARFKRARKDLLEEILRLREAEEISERRTLVFLEVLNELRFRTPNGEGRRRRRQMRKVGDV